MAVALVVMSASSNQDSKYMLPLVVYVAVVVCWFAARLHWPRFVAALIFVFAVQFAVTHAADYGLVGSRGGHSTVRRRVLRRTAGRMGELMQHVLASTRAEPGRKVLLATLGLSSCDLQFGAFDLAFYVSKLPGYEPGDGRRFRSVEFLLDHAGGDVDSVYEQVRQLDLGCAVLIDTARCPVSHKRTTWAAILNGAQEISRRIRGDTTFVQVGEGDGYEVQIYCRSEVRAEVGASDTAVVTPAPPLPQRAR
jgi:hypothetical protein